MLTSNTLLGSLLCTVSFVLDAGNEKDARGVGFVLIERDAVWEDGEIPNASFEMTRMLHLAKKKREHSENTN